MPSISQVKHNRQIRTLPKFRDSPPLRRCPDPAAGIMLSRTVDRPPISAKGMMSRFLLRQRRSSDTTGHHARFLMRR